MNALMSRHALAVPKRPLLPDPMKLPPRHRRASLAELRVLFLDFDGVLHPTLAQDARDKRIETGLFGWLPALTRMLRPHPDVVIVVHSTWRYTHNDEELRELLESISDRVVGSTPPGPRYESIQAWLRLHRSMTDHRILDDETLEFPDPLPAELVVCDPRMGVTAPGVQAALRQWLGT